MDLIKASGAGWLTLLTLAGHVGVALRTLLDAVVVEEDGKITFRVTGCALFGVAFAVSARGVASCAGERGGSLVVASRARLETVARA